MKQDRAPVLKMSKINKSYGGLRAVRDVDLELHPGEVLAIVGDNGAGKSTLIKVLTGVEEADTGTIELDGEEKAIRDRRSSIDAGIEAVYQNLGLVETLPAPANVFLGNEPVLKIAGIPFIDNRTMRRETERILRERVGMRLPDLDVAVQSFSGGQRQAVAIARAIYHSDIKVLVMDEPTAALGPEETRATLDLIRSIRDRGIAVILICHNLEDVFAVADRVMVMRNGRRVGVVEIAKSSRKDVLGMIIGSERGEIHADSMA